MSCVSSASLAFALRPRDEMNRSGASLCIPSSGRDVKPRPSSARANAVASCTCILSLPQALESPLRSRTKKNLGGGGAEGWGEPESREYSQGIKGTRIPRWRRNPLALSGWRSERERAITGRGTGASNAPNPFGGAEKFPVTCNVLASPGTGEKD